ncbi:phage head closure protein [Magnetococcus sp. PR-3]|uniref:phage head closure protein n=1 Tax=Magnetococcus sp. PR-3 TaxID=3120355 RepID=UPI002FCE1F26
MRAGRLRERLIIEQKMVTKNADYGSEVETWVVFAELRAEVLRVDGGEQVLAERESGYIHTKFRVRSVTGIHARMRIVHNGVIHQIRFVENIKDGGRELVLHCEVIQ